MNLIDVLLILIVVLAMWAGWVKGFIIGVTDLSVWLGSLPGRCRTTSKNDSQFGNMEPAFGLYLDNCAFPIDTGSYPLPVYSENTYRYSSNTGEPGFWNYPGNYHWLHLCGYRCCLASQHTHVEWIGKGSQGKPHC